ncbi:YggT family protein [Aestuariimicrobium ganziense]|uniref:YggT family protein n=1 Tax=Aestuariimicrobium ganziense TaxID=2773677 RepID=UPI00194528CA|nr:YggT family protein [Aestuariimicrobium ganziense]
MAGIGTLIVAALQLYLLLFLVRMVLSLVPALSPGFTPRGGTLVLFEVVYTLTDPLIRFYERFLPPLRLGQVSFSLGFLAAWFTLVALQRLTVMVFHS